MLKLIEGGFFAGGHEYCIKEIERLVAQGRRTVVIVPEQETLAREREMTDILPPSAALTLEVTNFTRFADLVFRNLGGISGNSATKAKKALIMWRTLTELSPLLKTCAKGEVNAGSVTRMLAAVREMQAKAIDSADLMDAAISLEKESAGTDSRLINKLSDIAQVIPLYKQLLNRHFTDADDALTVARGKLADTGCAFLSGTQIYVDGFTSFTEPQLAIIDVLIRNLDVTVNLGLPKHAADSFEYTELKKTHLSLARIAAKAGIDVQRKQLDGRDGSTPLITEIATLLWRSGCKIDREALKDTSGFRIFEADDPYEECDFIAQDIKRRVMSGARYSDFAVMARNIEEYDGIIDVSFEKAGVPLFLSVRSDISSFEAIKLIYSAIEASVGGFSRRDVISYSKCALSGVERALADEFELYAEKWQIDGTRFTDGVVWNMNPDGYTSRRSEHAEEKLLRINSAREQIISPLADLAAGFESASTVKDQLCVLYEFLTKLNIEKRLKDDAKSTLFPEGSARRYALSKLWRTICDTLDGMNEVLGDLKVTPKVFVTLLKTAFAETDIGRIPAFSDEVSAASASTARMYGKKHVYVIGLNQGKFPMAVDDDGYFTDKDKYILGGLGLGIEADTDVKSAAELYYLSRAISYATETVTLTYPAFDSGFKPSPVSDAIGRIAALSGNAITPAKLSDLMPCDKIFSREYAIEHLNVAAHDTKSVRDALVAVGDNGKIVISEAPIRNSSLCLSKDTLDAIYGDSIDMSQSRLEKYIGCPMSYFCTYDLHLHAEERVEFDNRNIGIFIHSILENFFAELKKNGKRIGEITEEQKDDLVRRVATKYVTAAFEGAGELPMRLKVTIENLCKYSMPLIDSLCDEFADCEFEPVFFELSIDKTSRRSPEPSVFKTKDGREIYFCGKVDRVDTYQSGDDVYVRVIDYKTGAKDFKPSDIEEGKNLQMFLYLKSIVESEKESFRSAIGVGSEGKMIPAGVIYVKANVSGCRIQKNDADEALKEAKKKQIREGMLLNDSTSIGAMNGKFIPVKFKADGDPDAYSKAKLYTAERWNEITETMNRIVSDECTKMVLGDICAKPLREKRGKSSVCKWCEFKPICRNSNAPANDDE